jgi:transposase
MGRHDLTDGQFARVECLLPANGRRGGQWKDHRPVVNGMVWRLKTGAPWRDVPPEYGPWKTVYDRFNRWCADGTLLGIAECLLAELDAEGRIDWDLWCIDGSVIRGSRAAGGARADSVEKKAATAASSPSRRTTPWAAARAGSGPSCTWSATAMGCRWRWT